MYILHPICEFHFFVFKKDLYVWLVLRAVSNQERVMMTCIQYSVFSTIKWATINQLISYFTEEATGGNFTKTKVLEN